MIDSTKPHTLNGSSPHESWGGWQGFLDSCDVRGKIEGCTWYGKTNCNYFLFSDNTVFENFGFHADNLWRRINEEGADVCLARIKKTTAATRKIIECIKAGDWQGAEDAGKDLELAPSVGD